MAKPVPSLPTQLAVVLEQLAQTRAALEHLEFEAVQLVRAAGGSWDLIGDELGISRQAATSRFSHPKPRRQTGRDPG